jgi:hypothetical protein
LFKAQIAPNEQNAPARTPEAAKGCFVSFYFQITYNYNLRRHQSCKAHFVRLIYAITILIASQIPVLALTPQEIPFELRDGFVWIEVAAARADRPLHFLLDSGAQVSVVNSTVGKKLGMQGGKSVGVMGVGKETAGLWPQTLEAHAGTVELPRNYLALDLSELSQACTNAPVDGIIGADFFHDRIVQLDYVHKFIRILAETPVDTGTKSLPIKVRPCGMLVPIRINDSKPQWVRLDTGCASAFQWVTGSVRADQCTRRVAVALTKISVPVTRTTLTLGTERFENVATDVHAREIFPGEKGILGNGLLSRFSTVTVDAKGGRLFLR